MLTDPPAVSVPTADYYRMRDAAEAYDRKFPCDGGCSVNVGAEETCSRHGRPPAELWTLLDRARQRVRALEEAIDDLGVNVSDDDGPYWDGYRDGQRREIAVVREVRNAG